MKFKAFCATFLALFVSTVSTPASALQCVPFARETSGIEIFGNARTWWNKAAGLYERGKAPQVGAVMAFKPTRGMPIGHVATVSQIISDREVLINHANWSRINGRRGQIERNVRVLDVSDAGDWSKVRVWYAPLQDLGTSSYPLYGFIYGGKKVTPALPRDNSPLIGPDVYRLATLEAAI